MSNTGLVTSRKKGGIVPAVASALIPGVGQLINGDTSKALGVFAVCSLASLGFWGSIPLLGTAAAVVFLASWVYGIGDGYSGSR